MLKNLPCNAGDTCLIPDWGTKVPHAAEQPSLHPTTRVHVLRPEIPHDTTKTQNSWKNKKKGFGAKVFYTFSASLGFCYRWKKLYHTTPL